MGAGHLPHGDGPKWIRRQIGRWGGSYGGYLHRDGALARIGSRSQRESIYEFGVHNWDTVIRGFLPSYDPLKQVG